MPPMAPPLDVVGSIIDEKSNAGAEEGALAAGAGPTQMAVWEEG